MTKASREVRESHWGSGERGESPQLNVKSMGKGERGGNRDLPGPGGMLRDVECVSDRRSG